MRVWGSWRRGRVVGAPSAAVLACLVGCAKPHDVELTGSCELVPGEPFPVGLRLRDVERPLDHRGGPTLGYDVDVWLGLGRVRVEGTGRAKPREASSGDEVWDVTLDIPELDQVAVFSFELRSVEGPTYDGDCVVEAPPFGSLPDLGGLVIDRSVHEPGPRAPRAEGPDAFRGPLALFPHPWIDASVWMAAPQWFQHFTRISIGHDTGCGLEEDGAARCWGAYNEVGTAPGPFVDLVRYDGFDSGHGAILLQADGHVVRMDNGELSQFDTPLALLPNDGFGCGLGLDGALACWDHDVDDAFVAALPDDVVEIDAFVMPNGLRELCVLRASGEVLCEPATLEDWSASLPERLLSTVAMDQDGGCGLDLDGELHCWGPRFEAFDGRFDDVVEVRVASVLDAGAVCARDVDGAIGCSGPVEPPPADRGPYVELGLGEGCACGLDVDGVVWCGEGDASVCSPP